MRDAILAGGIVLGHASQLSVPGLGMGPGEFLLMVWIMLSAARIVAGGRSEFSPLFVQFAGFWIAFAFTLSIGVFVGYFAAPTLFPSAKLHDSMAYVLLAAMTCLATAEPDASQRLRKIAWWVVILANAVLSVQVAQSLGLVHLAGVEPWFWDRFQGWSLNPNQLALYCALFGPLALHLGTTSKTTGGRILGLLCIILPVYVGRLTKSDSFLFGTLLSCLIFIGLSAGVWLAKPAARTLSRQLAVLLIIASLPLALASTPYILRGVGGAEAALLGMTKGKGGAESEATAKLRLSLWENATAMGLTSMSLGLGPGPHLQQPFTVNRQFEPVPFEAHNTLVDIFTQGGLAAVALLVWMVVKSAWTAWKANCIALLALVVSVCIFSFPHLTIRHPIVWFSFMMCLSSAPGRAPVRATASRGDVRCAA